MAEEVTATPGDVQADDTAPAPSPEAIGTEQAQEPALEPQETPQTDPDIRFSLVDDTTEDAGSVEGAGTERQQVPSYRLREEAEKRRAAEAELARTRQTIAMIQAQQQQAAVSNPVAAGETEEDKLRRSFGTEEEGGPAAYEAVKNVSQHEARQLINQAKAELRNEVQAEIQGQVGGVTASITTSQELAGMKAQGLIDASAETEISQRMGQAIAQNPEWGKGNNQRFLLNEIYMGMLKGGEIRPGVAPPPPPATPSGNGNSIHQPGSGGQRLTPAQQRETTDGELRNMQQRFPRQFGNLSIEQLRELHTNALGDTADGEASPSPATGPPMAYVHTRPRR
jgi:hypothetical protein